MSNEKYLISIIIPVFNSEKNIHRTFDSIKQQTIDFNNLEIIFVDDCSTDNSKNIIKNYSEQYENVISIFLDKNSGFGGKPRNVGMYNASADYIMFIDSDDIFYPNSCEFLYDKITSNDYDLVSGNYVVSVNGKKEKNVWKNIKLNNNELYVKDVLENNDILLIPPSIMSKIYKKSIILENDLAFPTGVPGEDLIFSTEYLLNSKNFLFVDVPIFEYIIRDDGEDKSVSYERGKIYLMGLMESYINLLYMLFKFNEQLINGALSRLNYWIMQFVDTNLSLSDRITLLKFSEHFFIHFKKNNLKPFEGFELLFRAVYEKEFYNASRIAELIYIKRSSSLSKQDNEKINQELVSIRKYLDSKKKEGFIPEKISFDEKIADINLELYFINKFRDEYNKDNIKKAIKLINKWDLFDYDYYLEKYDYKLNFDPLLHYICWGYKEFKNPNKRFDNIFYQKTYKNANKSHINPLIYFVNVGIDKGEIQIGPAIPKEHTCIDKTKLEDKINNFHELGVTKNKRDTQLIISLTSFPERMHDIKFTLYSLLNQKLKPDKVVLWLAENQFPNKEKDIPLDVLKLLENGLMIEWCDDLKSYKKLIPSLKKYSNEIIVTADDDLFYPKNWLKILYLEYKNHPDCIISQRVRKVKFNSNEIISPYSQWGLILEESNPSFLNFPTNGAGSLFPPNSLHQNILNEKMFKKLCPTGDDIWIWAMAILNNTKVKGVKDNYVKLNYVNLARDLKILNQVTLYSTNFNANDNQIKNVLDYFPEILEKLKEESKRDI